jgi:photosystem II stability/assembly factor-like uncharacterized protein
VDSTTRRILVFRGTTDAGNPAEAAYSDDGGATWTLVDIGTDNGEFVVSAKAAYAINQNNIWVGTDSGRIYFSASGGASWVVQEDQGIHSAAWNWVHFSDDRNGFAGGAGDVVAVTTDGGDVWSQVNATGNGGDITAGGVVDTNNFWVGTDDGEVFFTTDAGVTWEERSFSIGAAGAPTLVDDIRFVDNMLGFMSVRNAAAKSTILMTRTGGYNWEIIETATNVGINALAVCGPRLVYAVGEVVGSTPVVYKLQPTG